ncbi:hypothetical protein FHS18_004065 [Paenibacillus phyllosphaerae]|uniref:Uncharacterized protein n=1 Tax=Paenibacillus phyllosphaerae TaxID=274593 RepID=A0A7W5B071_9BACL|nr:hypothetical protein [Paenibacillus phyllosphaerae]
MYCEFPNYETLLLIFCSLSRLLFYISPPKYVNIDKDGGLCR